MKKSILFLSVLFVAQLAFAGTPGKFTVTSRSENKTTLQFEAGAFSLGNSHAKHYLVAENSVSMLVKGAPEIPVYATSVQVENTGAVSIAVSYGSYEDIANVDLLPSKGSLKRNIDPSTVPYEYGTVYQANAFFPGMLAEAGKAHIIRHGRYVTVRTFPFQYNPVTRTLRVYRDLQISVTSNTDLPGENELLHAQRNGGGGEDVQYTQLPEFGRMLVISPANMIPIIQPLVDWKKQKGFETDVADIATIGNNETSIKNYIATYYGNHPDLMFVLLIGDHAQVNSYDAGNTGWETKWSDSEYGQLSGNDKYPEVYVGRLSTANTTTMGHIVSRILEYEKTPNNGTWYHNAIGIGSDEGAGIGDDNEADWQHQRNMRTKLLAYGYTTVHEFYDNSHGGADAAGDPTPTMVQSAMDQGASLFNYTGHGDQNTCVTSNYSSTEVWAASNNHMYPFVISVACNNGTFTSGTCLGEDFLRAYNSNGPIGSIAACGSSILMAWAEPMQVQDEMTDILTEQYPTNIKRTLGGLFFHGGMSMLDDYNSSGTAEEVMETWIMFGDPSVMMRTATPTPLTGNHVISVPMGTTTIAVNCNTDGALVCITQNNVILGTGTVSSGVATINIPAVADTTDLLVTATAFNKTPYQGTIDVTTITGLAQQSAGNALIAYPNPAAGQINAEFFSNGTEAVLEVLNTLGQTVERRALGNLQQGFNKCTIELDGLEKGVYFLRLSDGAATSTQRFMVK